MMKVCMYVCICISKHILYYIHVFNLTTNDDDDDDESVHSPVQAVYIQSNSPHSERTVLIPFYGWSWILYYCCRHKRNAGSDNYKAVKSDD